MDGRGGRDVRGNDDRPTGGLEQCARVWHADRPSIPGGRSGHEVDRMAQSIVCGGCGSTGGLWAPVLPRMWRDARLGGGCRPSTQLGGDRRGTRRGAASAVHPARRRAATNGSANGHDVVEGQLSTWSEPAEVGATDLSFDDEEPPVETPPARSGPLPVRGLAGRGPTGRRPGTGRDRRRRSTAVPRPGRRVGTCQPRLPIEAPPVAPEPRRPRAAPAHRSAPRPRRPGRAGRAARRGPAPQPHRGSRPRRRCGCRRRGPRPSPHRRCRPPCPCRAPRPRRAPMCHRSSSPPGRRHRPEPGRATTRP